MAGARKAPAKATAQKAAPAKKAPAKRAPAQKRTAREVPVGTLKVSGVSSAWVNRADGVTVQVYEGEPIPEVSADELDRLKGLNVFGDHPRDENAAAERAAAKDARDKADAIAEEVETLRAEAEVRELAELQVAGFTIEREGVDPDAVAAAVEAELAAQAERAAEADTPSEG